MENNSSLLKLRLKKEFLLFDGAMGTMLQENGLEAGELPELLNITHPQDIIDVHLAYVKAGSQIITANTFGANRLKLENTDYTVEEIITKAIDNAKAANPEYVALDLGPIGQLLAPMGTLSFDEAYDIYKEQIIAGTKAGADILLMETLSDLYEAKAAILAAKENSHLPIICSFTFQEDCRTFVGTDPITATLTLQAFGVDALGVNCSLGPEGLHPIVDDMLKYAKVPVLVQANAGLPKMVNNKTTYVVGPDEYAFQIKTMLDKGVTIVGGCCGTTPAHMVALKEVISKSAVTDRTPMIVTATTSGLKTVILDNKMTIIGERINPTGKKKLKAALVSQDLDYIINEAISQTNAGSDVLDINVGLPEIDEVAIIQKVIPEVQAICPLPLQVDSADPCAIEAGVRIYNGKPIINSVNGKDSSLAEILPIVKKYGALIIGLTLDEEGIPDSAEKRVAIAKKIMDTANTYGIPKEDIVIDTLSLTASAQQEQAVESLKAITMIKNELGLKCVLGISNVSFGLPNRPLLNSTFLTMAAGAGLDIAIINPLSAEMMGTIDAIRVLNAQDANSKHFIQTHSQVKTEVASVQATYSGSLKEMILEGRKNEAAPKVAEMLKEEEPLAIIDNHIIPTLDLVGQQFEKGEIFLPQLMQSAETVKQAFEVIKDHFLSVGDQQQFKGKILLATVKGDIHDIGKNIVKLLLENYGYKIYDMGKDVPIMDIVNKVKEENIPLVGLSALMTTTVRSMEETIKALRAEKLTCKVFIGGAVLNQEYADMVGADYYAKDARDGVKFAQQFFGAN